MKYFRLAEKAYRETVDLRLYEDDIAAAIAKVRPDVDTQLFVEQDGFYTVPELGKRESILLTLHVPERKSSSSVSSLRNSLEMRFKECPLSQQIVIGSETAMHYLPL